ncbi:hypothetical protein [Kitasatospora sp. NPDC058218]|uniref:hypothetical protein n=1 Tax=Kitasatospora sp. NPDC058218 TaxID=3346385 RepID=UPI0036DA6039
MDDDQDFEALLERSSLGSPGARRLRARTPAVRADTVHRIIELRHTVIHSDGSTAADASRKLAELLRCLEGGAPSSTPERLATEIQRTWNDIRAHHQDLPVLTSPEALVSVFSHTCGRRFDFEWLLHEAAHRLAAARGIRDTSRARRYHNRHFMLIASELGLAHPIEPHPSTGFSRVTMLEATRERYAETMERFSQALREHELVPHQATFASV